MIGSYLAGATSVLAGHGSALSAVGVCAPFPGLFLTDGASFNAGGESLLSATTPPACSSCPSTIPTEAGLFTLSDASGPALILATAPYDFSCIPQGHVHLAATADYKYLAGGNIFPKFGIFIVTVVPPAADLFTLIPPDVQITTAIPPHDGLFHTFTGSNTIVNPGAARTVIFAVGPDSSGTHNLTPTDYAYQNFTFTVTGV